MAKELYQQGLLQQQPLTSLGEEGSVSCTLISLHLSQVNTHPPFRFVPTVTSLGDTLSHPPWVTRWSSCGSGVPARRQHCPAGLFQAPSHPPLVN